MICGMPTPFPSLSEPSTSASLLQRATEGDASAWQRIVHLYGPLVYQWARRSGLQSADAADIVQETFTAVAGRLGLFDSERSGATFRGWLWTITRNKVVDVVRRRSRRPQSIGGSTAQQWMQDQAGDAAADSPSTSLSETEPPSDAAIDQRAVLHRAVSLLRDRFEATTWQAFWRTVVDGCDPAEVADELGISRWAVYKARSRVLQRLRTELGGLESL